MLGGRVKTLHPRIHGAILARRDVEADLEALEEHGIEPFDLVCVNLYPFAQVAGRKDVREEEAVEMIDIGGPAMLRAAAKNFEHVAPVCSIARYDSLLLEIQATGEIDATTRRELAAEAFAHTAAYEASIASWFGDRETFPPKLIVALQRERELTYGENPHQRAAYYVEIGSRRDLLVTRRAALRQGPVLQQSGRPGRSARGSGRVRAPDLRRGQARESVRGGSRFRPRGRGREGLCRRPGVRLRRRRRGESSRGPATRQTPR
jgi:hypothetical protein